MLTGVQELRTGLLTAADVRGFPGGVAWHAVCTWIGVASTPVAYQPRIPAQDVLYQVVRDHYGTFRAQAASIRDGEGLPRFVEEEFSAFLRCGFLAGGCARFRCDNCGLDRLVRFSCKGRAALTRPLQLRLQLFQPVPD